MQEIIEWDDKYLTGIEVIDSQHKLIFKKVNLLYYACEKMEEREKIFEIITELDFYTLEHFATEEKYMLELKYPAYPEHKEAHENFKNIYARIRSNYTYEKSQAVYMQAIHLNQCMAEWLNYHLQNEDRQLAIFLKSKIT